MVRPRRYRSDLSDSAWERITRFLVPRRRKGGRPCPPERRREYLDAMLCVLRTGCAWRHLSHDFTVSWSAAHKHILRWCRNGAWARILTAVRGEVRTRSRRRRRPHRGGRGFLQRPGVPGDRAARLRRREEIDGVTRHALVAPRCPGRRGRHPGRRAGPGRIPEAAAQGQTDRADDQPRIGRQGLHRPDRHHRRSQAGFTVDVVSGPKPGHGFIVQPRR